MTSTAPSDTLVALGLDRAPAVHRNDTAPRLYEETIRRGTGRLTAHGALNVDTTPYTGRSPKDKFVVRDQTTESSVAWGSVNQPFDPARYDALAARVREHLASRELWVQDLRAGAERKVLALGRRLIMTRGAMPRFADVLHAVEEIDI